MEGEVAFLKVALKIFQIIEPEIVLKDYAETLYLLRNCTHDININHLIYNFQSSSSLSQEKFEKSCKKEKEKQHKQERSRSMFG